MSITLGNSKCGDDSDNGDRPIRHNYHLRKCGVFDGWWDGKWYHFSAMGIKERDPIWYNMKEEPHEKHIFSRSWSTPHWLMGDILIIPFPHGVRQKGIRFGAKGIIIIKKKTIMTVTSNGHHVVSNHRRLHCVFILSIIYTNLIHAYTIHTNNHYLGLSDISSISSRT